MNSYVQQCKAATSKNDKKTKSILWPADREIGRQHQDIRSPSATVCTRYSRQLHWARKISGVRFSGEDVYFLVVL